MHSPLQPRWRLAPLGLLMVGALLSGCQPSAEKPLPAARLVAESRRPDAAHLSEKYERSCMTCHLDPTSGAPLTGDRAAWTRRASVGRDALITSVQQGRNNMPPMGLCPDCSRDDLAALIDFMGADTP